MRITIRSLLAVLALILGMLFAASPASAANVTVSGDVSSSKGAVTRGTVYFFANCEDYANKAPVAMSAFSSGTYTVSVPPGTYRVVIEPKSSSYHAVYSWHSASMTCEGATPVSITSDTWLDLVAAATVVLSGTVSTSEGPITTGVVEFLADCGALAPAASDPFLSDGYRVEVAPGNYKVRISVGPAKSWHPATPSCPQAPDLVAVNDATVNITGLPTRTITITASSARGPVSAGTVVMYFACRDVGIPLWQAPVFGQLSNGTLTTTVAEGSTLLAYLDPALGQGAVRSWHSKSLTCEGATPIVVQGNMNITIQAMAEHNVSGTVTTSSGPVAQGFLSFVSSCEPTSTHYEVPFDSGTYRGTLPEGTYRIRILARDVPDSWHNAVQTCEQSTPVTVSGVVTANLRGLDGRQTVTRPPKVVKVGKKVKLAKTTDRGQAVSWTSLTRKTCVVRKAKLMGTARGTCKVQAAAGGPFLTPLAKKFKVKIR